METNRQPLTNLLFELGVFFKGMILSFLVVFSGCSPISVKFPESTEASATTQLSTADFYDGQRGFLFQYPVGWDIENLGSPLEGRWDMLLKKDFPDNRALIHFTYFDSLELDRIYQEEKDRYFSSGVIQLKESRDVRVGNFESHVVEASIDDMDIRYMKMFVIRMEHKVVRFSLSLEENNPELLGLLEQCVYSIERR